MASDQLFAMPAMQPGEDSMFDIVGMFVRLSCPTETDRLTDRDRHARQTETDRQSETDRPKTNRRTHSLRAASSARRCE